VLVVLAVVRQVAAVGENRRLYRQVEEASDERRRLVAELLERAVDERRRFAGQLYEQALAAYTSFSVMAGSGHDLGDAGAAARSGVAAEVSARLGSDFARTAASVRELVLAIRPLEGEPTLRERLGVPIRAYLADIYGDRDAPRLTLTTAEGLAPDWMTETLVLQIVQEALHNVRRHSGASAVEVALDADGGTVRLRVVDDGEGFDPASVPEGSGIATMRACVAVAGGTLTVGRVPDGGVAVTARLGGGPPPDRGGSAPSFPSLRLVPPLPY
jgi:signal transduction histidine kinase